MGWREQLVIYFYATIWLLKASEKLRGGIQEKFSFEKLEKSNQKSRKMEMEQQQSGENDEKTVGGKFYPEVADEAEYQQLVQNPELFMQKLKDFHSSFNTHFMFVLSPPFSLLFNLYIFVFYFSYSISCFWNLFLDLIFFVLDFAHFCHLKSMFGWIVLGSRKGINYLLYLFFFCSTPSQSITTYLVLVWFKPWNRNEVKQRREIYKLVTLVSCLVQAME